MIVEEVLEWCQCGAGALSAVPTLLWALGAAALARRLLAVLFRRSVFRRTPYWELALQVTHGVTPQVLEWCQCGAGALSAVPTLLWALGAAALARRLLAVLFRRSVFRRTPYWELALQHLLFVWMVIYSVHLWVVLVRLVKLLVDLAYDETVVALYEPEQFPSARSKYMVEQCAVWAVSAVPLTACVRARPRPRPPPLMIWITTSPWQRRELGPHGYYLQRPAPPPAPPAPPPRRRALSDPALTRPHKHNKRLSKSV